jgi:hypothetical protein
MVFGYPLEGLLSSAGNFTSGLISSLRGLRDAANVIQFTAPVQSGNSGGPLLDASGLVIGVVQSKLSLRAAVAIGDIPQNVNFAVSLDVLSQFGAKQKIDFLTSPRVAALDTAAVAELAQGFTHRIECHAKQQRVNVTTSQRAVLYEEDPNDTLGKRFVGTVHWHTEMLQTTPGSPSELAVHAAIELPQRMMTVSLTIQRNRDQSLPASHTIEIKFHRPVNSIGVQSVPGFLMKSAEQTRGSPLTGLVVKVEPNYFLMGLSARKADLQSNAILLNERSWIDIPIVFDNNHRAIIAVEKGESGKQAFADAIAAWK